MSNQQVIDFIKGQRAAGVPDDKIRIMLLTNGGWSPTEIDAAFAAVAPTASTPPAPTFSTQPPKRKHVAILVSGIILVVLIGGLGVYAYSQGLILSRAPFKEGELFSGVAARLGAVNALTYTLSMHLQTVPRESDATAYVYTGVAANRQAAYGNDVERVSDLNRIASVIYNASTAGPNGTRIYPTSLSDAKTRQTNSYYSQNVSYEDPLNKPYVYNVSADRANYTLSTTLETDEAASYLASTVSKTNPTFTIDGRTLVIRAQSYNMYLPSTMPKPLIYSLIQSSKSAPSNMNFSVGITGNINRTNAGMPTNTKFGFDLNGTFDDLSFNVDAEMRKVGTDYYIIVNKFPSLLYFSYLSGVKGQWIKLNTATSTSPYGYTGPITSIGQNIHSTSASFATTSLKAQNDFKSILILADRTHVMTFTHAPTKETVNGVTAYRYDLSFEKGDIIAFLKALDVEASKPGHSELLGSLPVQQWLSYMERDDSQSSIDYLQHNMFMTIWANAAGLPVKSEFRLRVVPDDSVPQLAGKQLDFSIDLNLSDFNSPVKVDAPDTYITAEKADSIIMQSSAMAPVAQAGGNAHVLSDVQQIRTEFESEFNGSNYSSSLTASNTKTTHGAGIKTTNSTLKSLLDDIQKQGSIAYAITNASMTSYAVYGRLVSDTTHYFCVDSIGGTSQATSRNTSPTCK